ncbi:hypothetical protein [Nonomuraea sp. NPDC048901]|uniref:hypothetical protein n=1 Tax=Nonomuraea sp. NPDC048901 TaxID=3155627 RepID=UPI0033FBAA1A
MSMEIFTAEDVVSDLFAAEDTHYDDSGNGWHHEVTGCGNMIAIAITPSDDEGFKTDETFHFRAVVVEGEEAPIVLERPEELGIQWHEGGDLLALTHDGITLFPQGVDEWSMGPDNARELAAHLAAMADAYEAAQSGGVGE